MKNIIVVSDTTAITHLARINALILIKQLYMTVYIPEAVYKELTTHGEQIPGAKEVCSSTWIKVRKVKNQNRLNTHMLHLDPGESEAIALAQEINADLLIIDEKTGRSYAKNLGLEITGMIGILLIAKQKKLIPAIKPYLDRLIATRFKLGAALYHQALELAGEKNREQKA